MSGGINQEIATTGNGTPTDSKGMAFSGTTIIYTKDILLTLLNMVRESRYFKMGTNTKDSTLKANKMN